MNSLLAVSSGLRVEHLSPSARQRAAALAFTDL